MAPRSHDDEDAEKSRFRWLDAARYTVAAVVTVLIVAVIANAIKEVLRPDILYVSVVGGSVAAKRTPPTLTLSGSVLAVNPSGRAVMYYTNITGYLFDNNTSPNLLEDCFLIFGMVDMAIYQGRELNSAIFVPVDRGDSMSIAPYDHLSGGGVMRGVTMRLDGNVTTQTTSGGRNMTIPTTYYCLQIVVGGDPDDPANKGNDVMCTSDVVQGGSRRRRFWFSMLAAAMVALIQTFVM